MISEIVYKLNAFDSNFVALSEIFTAESAKKTPSIGELQKKYGEFLPIALEQLKLQDKVKKKLPYWVDSRCLFEQRAFEQSTSQTVAVWKANFFKATHVLSLTGGFGVDDWAWLNTGAKVISTDPNKTLNHLVRCNMQRLLTENRSFIRFDQTAEDLLANPNFSNSIPSPKTKDYRVYIDPDRRKGEDRLGGKAKEFSPNFIDIIKTHYSEFKTWLVKLSPMTDIHFLQKELNFPTRFYTVFYQGEVKELLIELGTEINGPNEFKSIYLQNYHLHQGLSAETKGDFDIWDGQSIAKWFESQTENPSQNSHRYFFEPHGGLNCLGLNKTFKDFLQSQNTGNTFFISAFRLPASLGRSLIIYNETSGSLKQIKHWLTSLGISKASLTSRECKGLNAVEIQKKLGLTEGGKHTIFITLKSGIFHCWICEVEK